MCIYAADFLVVIFLKAAREEFLRLEFYKKSVI